jgi:hypothetical protein
MQESPKAVAGRPSKIGFSKNPIPTLADAGIDKDLANQKTPERFEADLQKTITIAVAAAQGHKEVIAAARAERHHTKKKERKKREAKWASKVLALPSKKYGVVGLAPVSWRVEDLGSGYLV